MFAEDYYKVGIWVILGIIIAAYIGLSYLWNRKFVPMRRRRQAPTPYWGNAVKRVTHFAFKEDPRSITDFFKKKKNKEAAQEEGGATKTKGQAFVASLLTLKTINWILLITIFVMIGVNLWKDAWIPALILVCLVWLQTSSILAQRNSILQKMFAVASTKFRYGSGSDMNPWGFIRIKEWDDLTVPGKTEIVIPTAYDASSIGARDAFEAHFNTTVTDKNSWIYEWKTADGVLSCSPIGHLTERAMYDGSEKHPWNRIPLGIGLNGEVSVDLTATPHMLICGSTGSGKAAALNTPVFTLNGWSTIGELEVGDIIFDENGKETAVTHLHPIITPAKAYKVTFGNGETVVVDAQHLWATTERTENDVTVIVETGQEFLTNGSLFIVESQYENSAPEDTISLSDLGTLINRKADDPILVRLANEVGPAEEVREREIITENTDVVTNIKNVTYVDANEFIELFNARERTPATAQTPLSRSQFDRIQNLLYEVRDTDILTQKSIIEYVNTDEKYFIYFIKNHFDETLPTRDALNKLITIGSKKAGVIPDKIFTIEDKNVVTVKDIALLFNTPEAEVTELFDSIATKAETTDTVQELVEEVLQSHKSQLVRAPYFTYPKQLLLRRLINTHRGERLNTAVVKTTETMFETLWTNDEKPVLNHTIKLVDPIKFDEKQLPIYPYLYGLWVASGASEDATIITPTETVGEYLNALGYSVANDITGRVYMRSLSNADFVNNNEYLNSSVNQRRELLRGILDGAGTVTSSTISFTNKQKIVDFVQTLIGTLGYVATRVNETTVEFIYDSSDRFFVEPTKAALTTIQDTPTLAHQIVNIELVDSVPMRCISVDSPSRQFVFTKSFIPTHNSVLQRNLVFHCIQHNDMWRFLGVDVKRVELTPFKKYTKTVLGIGASLEDGVEIVRYAKTVMETRYEEMENLGINHFKDMKDANGRPPYALMLMVDEAFMFLSMEGIKTDEGKVRDELHAEAGGILGDIARLGRASGVHLVLATQRPDATVIKGELKANLDIRIAAGRLDATPSSMVLDSGAATQLPGHIKGRGIVRFGGNQEQFQGYFAEAEWIDRWLKANPGVEPDLYPAGYVDPTNNTLEDELEVLKGDLNFDDGAIEATEGIILQDELTQEAIDAVDKSMEGSLSEAVDFSSENKASKFVNKIRLGKKNNVDNAEKENTSTNNEEFSLTPPQIVSETEGVLTEVPEVSTSETETKIPPFDADFGALTPEEADLYIRTYINRPGGKAASEAEFEAQKQKTVPQAPAIAPTGGFKPASLPALPKLPPLPQIHKTEDS